MAENRPISVSGTPFSFDKNFLEKAAIEKRNLTEEQFLNTLDRLITPPLPPPEIFLNQGGITFQIWLKILKRAYFDFKIFALIKGVLLGRGVLLSDRV